MMVHDRLCEFPSTDVPPCVYFLIHEDRVLYVGQSRNLASRLAQHGQDGKRWERALFLPVPEANLLRVEAEWITAPNPPLNRTASRSRGARSSHTHNASCEAKKGAVSDGQSTEDREGG